MTTESKGRAVQATAGQAPLQLTAQQITSGFVNGGSAAQYFVGNRTRGGGVTSPPLGVRPPFSMCLHHWQGLNRRAWKRDLGHSPELLDDPSEPAITLTAPSISSIFPPFLLPLPLLQLDVPLPFSSLTVFLFPQLGNANIFASVLGLGGGSAPSFSAWPNNASTAHYSSAADFGQDSLTISSLDTAVRLACPVSQPFFSPAAAASSSCRVLIAAQAGSASLPASFSIAAAIDGERVGEGAARKE